MANKFTKVRLGVVLANQLGWGRPLRVVPALVLRDDRSARRVLERHDSLFRLFGVRVRSAMAWIRSPIADVSGILWFERTDSDQGPINGSTRVRGGRHAG